MKAGVILLFITALIVIAGCITYLNDHIGVAQFLFVLASGTAGGGVVLIIEHEGD